MRFAYYMKIHKYLKYLAYKCIYQDFVVNVNFFMIPEIMLGLL